MSTMSNDSDTRREELRLLLEEFRRHSIKLSNIEPLLGSDYDKRNFRKSLLFTENAIIKDVVNAECLSLLERLEKQALALVDKNEYDGGLEEWTRAVPLSVIEQAKKEYS